jgi:4-amino-4-deoxy-L-arabinose transferase-like glycosyltransferase
MIFLKICLFFLLPCFLILLCTSLISQRTERKTGIRDLLIYTFVCWSILLVVITEGLSLFKGITRDHLQLSWLVVDAVLAGMTVFQFIRAKQKKVSLPWRSVFDPIRKIGSESRFEWAFLGVLAFMLITMALVAYVYPPTNYDSLAYHLARVEHWIQNQSIAPYATAIDRQIQMPPFAEEVSLHLLLLTGNDHLANFVQFTSLIVCLLGVTNLTKKLGGSRLQQQIAALLCASIPIVILESTSTQNDMVMAAMLVCFIDIGLNLIRKPGFHLAALAGAALGLAVYTKSTSYVFVLPFCIYFGVQLIRKEKKKAILLGGIIAGILVLVNLGQYARMIQVFGAPLGPTSLYQNEETSLRGLTSNILRNTALNFLPEEVDNAAVNDLSNYANKFLLLAHQITGLDPEDSRFTMKEQNVFEAFARTTDDRVANPFQILFILAALAVMIYKVLKKQMQLEPVWLTVCLLAGFLVYSLIFKWQPWGVRLFLPLFVLWTPIIALLLFGRRHPVIHVIPIALALVSINLLFTNQAHPILTTKYLMQNDNIYWKYYGMDYPDAAKLITQTGCKNVGLIIDENAPEYLFWHALNVDGFRGRIEHVEVTNDTARFADENFEPCAVFDENPNKTPAGYSNWKVSKTESGAVYFRPDK